MDYLFDEDYPHFGRFDRGCYPFLGPHWQPTSQHSHQQKRTRHPRPSDLGHTSMAVFATIPQTLKREVTNADDTSIASPPQVSTSQQDSPDDPTHTLGPYNVINAPTLQQHVMDLLQEPTSGTNSSSVTAALMIHKV